MKRLALFAVCAIAATAAADEWHYLSGGRLSGISSVGSHVWAVGQDGLFFYSEDNGGCWRRVPRFTTRNLVDVEFWDQSFGLITAEGDIIYRTTDNGGTWDSTYVQYVGGRIRFITRHCIWVVINDRNLRSSDGGLTWSLKGRPYDNSWFTDSLNGWCSLMTLIYRTTDAGQHWSYVGEVPLPYSSGGVDCLGFTNQDTGVCAWRSSFNSGFHTYFVCGWSATTDGGASWDSLTGYTTRGVACDIGPEGRVCGVEERGWVVYEPPLCHRSGASQIEAFRDISAVRGERAWVCGDGGAIWSSSDSGISWDRAKPQSGATLRNVDFIDSLHGWAASALWPARTSDGGRYWVPASAGPPVSPVSDVLALDESAAFVAGAYSEYDPMNMWWYGHFALGLTTDAGDSWASINPIYFDYGASPIGSSRFARVDRHIWHPGVWTPDGNSLRSTDGGTTWLDMDTLGTRGYGEPFDISFFDMLNGWVIDSRSNIRRTTDGGDSWTIIATGIGVKRLKMTSLTTGWAISDSELFETTTGGMTWNGGVVHSGLQAIAFCDSLHGAIVGKKGLILRTSDGGQTWIWDGSKFTSDLYDVFVLDSTHAWAVGANGLVLGFGDWAIGVDEARGYEGLYNLAAGVAVRPNPCRGRVSIEFSRPLVRPMQATLVDVAGRVQQAIPAPSGVRSLELDLRATPSGVYFLRAGSGTAARLVIQR
ncbi:hypothetical protein FJY68_03800 [candidate division WOR-3 bacterium]|uniref:T9SS type A sorting domain-containing protein n=1 Tax=candidate division WOR-3 bacterium TaxID=2052148 RepID=A0A938BQT6_UNCW3|nr:hypothetical protein [candidate division WOR-3 bacterium]